MSNKDKLIINKKNHEIQPHLQSPDIDSEKFKTYYNDQKVAAQMLSRICNIENLEINIKILTDSLIIPMCCVTIDLLNKKVDLATSQIIFLKYKTAFL